MQIKIEHSGIPYHFETSEVQSLAIPMDFEGTQPNHFGTEKAVSSPLELGDFVGETESGGSCNVDVIQLIPHCNGTHTETISHIVHEDIWIGHAVQKPILVAALLTVNVIGASKTHDSYRPQFDTVDAVIDVSALRSSAERFQLKKLNPEALIIRSNPNSVDKKSRNYNEKNQPPFLTIEAIKWVNDLGVRHLLVDFPSVDRMYDDGLLTNHHLFWNVKEGTHQLNDQSWQDKTITEMIFVPDEIADGAYALNLQFPSFCADAAPSRPVIMPLEVAR